jgi:hypothetical protein
MQTASTERRTHQKGACAKGLSLGIGTSAALLSLILPLHGHGQEKQAPTADRGLSRSGALVAAGATNRAAGVFELANIRREASAYAEALLVPGRPYGAYRHPQDSNSTLYAACDVAIMRTIMGENLRRSLTSDQRSEWISHINSFAQADGTYGPGLGNRSPEHANGMVISALGPLGGRQKYPVRLYDSFDTVEEVEPWLEKMDWRNQWSGSHRFWGGLHCFSCSSRCTPEWREKVFAWLDRNLDRETGWWRVGVPHQHPGVDGLGGGCASLADLPASRSRGGSAVGPHPKNR